MNSGNRLGNRLVDRRRCWYACQISKKYKYHYPVFLELRLCIIRTWWKSYRWEHLVEHQGYTMPSGVETHGAASLLFTDRNKCPVDTRALGKMNGYFLSSCSVFHSVLWECLQSKTRSVTQGQLVLAVKGMCHGLTTSNTGVSKYDPHHTGHVEVLQHLFILKYDVVLYHPKFHVNCWASKQFLWGFDKVNLWHVAWNW